MSLSTTSAQAQSFAQTFDGYTAGTTQSFGTVTGVFPVSNTDAGTLFPNANTGSSVTGGNAGSNYVTFGTVAAGLGGTTFSVHCDINFPAPVRGACS